MTRAAVSSSQASENAQPSTTRTASSPSSSSVPSSSARAASSSTRTGAWTRARTIEAGSPASRSLSRASSRPRGGAGSRTTAPPTVVSLRRTTRSPRAARTGAARRSWACSSPTRTTRPGMRLVPWCTESRAPSAIGCELLERDLEPVGAGEGAGGDEHVAAGEVAPLETRQAHRHALPGLGPLDRGVVHLDGPDPDVAAGGLQPQLVAVADRPRPERPRRDGADPPQREDPVDVEPGREVGPALLDLVGHLAERDPEGVEALAGDAADGHDRGVGDELTRLLDGELERLLVDGVGLGHGDDAAVDAEQAQDREVLVRLRPCALRRVEHEEIEVDPRCPGDHRPHEPLVPRDVDQRRPSAHPAARAARSRGRSRCPARAPRGGGRCPCR